MVPTGTVRSARTAAGVEPAAGTLCWFIDARHDVAVSVEDDELAMIAEQRRRDLARRLANRTFIVGALLAAAWLIFVVIAANG